MELVLTSVVPVKMKSTLGNALMAAVPRFEKQESSRSAAEEQEKEAALGGPICKDIPLLKALFEQTNGPDWLSEKRVKTNLVLFEADQMAKLEVCVHHSYYHCSLLNSSFIIIIITTTTTTTTPLPNNQAGRRGNSEGGRGDEEVPLHPHVTPGPHF